MAEIERNRGGFCKNLGRMLDKTFRLCRIRILFAAGVAQLVERNLAKVEVASSRLVSRSMKVDESRTSGLTDVSQATRE